MITTLMPPRLCPQTMRRDALYKCRPDTPKTPGNVWHGPSIPVRLLFLACDFVRSCRIRHLLFLDLGRNYEDLFRFMCLVLSQADFFNWLVIANLGPVVLIKEGPHTYAILKPTSPIMAPRRGSLVHKHLTYTMKRCRRIRFSPMTSWAMTTACVVEKPKPAGQELTDETVGEWMRNSSVLKSKVAVVSRPRTNEPCPSSVWQ